MRVARRDVACVTIVDRIPRDTPWSMRCRAGMCDTRHTSGHISYGAPRRISSRLGPQRLTRHASALRRPGEGLAGHVRGRALVWLSGETGLWSMVRGRLPASRSQCPDSSAHSGFVIVYRVFTVCLFVRFCILGRPRIIAYVNWGPGRREFAQRPTWQKSARGP